MSEWRHNNGYLIKHTIRVAKADFDTEPSEEYKQEIFDYLCKAANGYEELEQENQRLREALKDCIGLHSVAEHAWDVEEDELLLKCKAIAQNKELWV